MGAVNNTPQSKTHTLDAALAEWKSQDRTKIGCVQAANWFCTRVAGFKPIRFTRAAGNTSWEHVLITDGVVLIDPSPWNDTPGRGPLFGMVRACTESSDGDLNGLARPFGER